MPVINKSRFVPALGLAASIESRVLVIDSGVTDTSSMYRWEDDVSEDAAASFSWTVAAIRAGGKSAVRKGSPLKKYRAYFCGSAKFRTSVAPLERAGKHDLDMIVICSAGTAATGFAADRTEGANLLKRWWAASSPAASTTLPVGSDDEAGAEADTAVPQAKDILTRLSTATEIGETEAVKLVYEQVNKQVARGADGIRALDAFLGVLNVKRFPGPVLQSILDATSQPNVRPQIPSRKPFTARVQEILAKRNERAHGQRPEGGAVTEAIPAKLKNPLDVNSVGRFLDGVYRLGRANDLQGATDKVFGHIDDLLHEEDYEACDEILKQVDAKQLPTALLRSFLTITAPAKSKLRYREAFYRAAFAEMARVKGDVAKAHKLLGPLA